jgi:hypothetical protein
VVAADRSNAAALDFTAPSPVAGCGIAAVFASAGLTAPLHHPT